MDASSDERVSLDYSKKRYVAPSPDVIRAYAQRICDQMGCNNLEIVGGLANFIGVVSSIHARHLNEKGTEGIQQE